MKIVRSIGNSITGFDDPQAALPQDKRAGLARRVVPKADRAETINSHDLPDWIGAKPDLAIRQIISILDKVIKKPRHLKDFNVIAYVDRTRLAQELWARLTVKLAPTEFEATWNAKVHPYAKFKLNESNPAADDNAKAIKAAQNPNATAGSKPSARETFEGRWHSVFWKFDENGNPDFPAIAEKILEHAFEQERVLSQTGSKVRKKGKDETQKGLIFQRAKSIADGANNPIMRRNGLNLEDGSDDQAWTKAEEDDYFRTDIAKDIHASCCEFSGRNEPLHASHIGQILFDHFGPIIKQELPEEQRFRLWRLHNEVRKFYRLLAKSERFRRASRAMVANDAYDSTKAELAQKEAERLAAILPKDKAALLKAIGAKDRNADFSELIRLGKVIIHASDTSGAESGMDADSFKQRVNELITSKGQAEIKRNEAFVRVWRNATGLSFQTLRTLTKAAGHADDLSGKDESICAADDARAADLDAKIGILFGDKAAKSGECRSAIFKSRDDASATETMWGLLRIAATIRNRTNHFMIKDRLVDLVKAGVVIANDQPPALAQRRGEVVSQATLEQCKALLDFDIALQAEVIASSLRALKADAFLTQDHANSLAAELATTSDSELMLPRFMAMLRKAKNLVGNNVDNWPTPLQKVAGIDLRNLPEATDANRCKIGLLRTVYESGFRAWLADGAPTGENFAAAVRLLLDAKSKRIATIQEEHKQFYQLAESRLADLRLDSFEDIGALIAELTRISAEASGNTLRYKPIRGKQRSFSEEIEAFKQEFVAALFSKYLGEKELGWIWEIPEDPLEVPADLDALPTATSLQFENWAPQFYTWLYFLPPDTVSLLRHQFRKTLVLENKHEAQADDASASTLRELDRLMGLYTRVQGAGFAGTEGGAAQAIAALCYEDPAQASAVFSQLPEDQEKYRISGTLRGLREITRFGHLTPMTKLYGLHKVTKAEVETLMNLRDPKTEETAKALFQRKNSLHDELVALNDESPKANATAIAAHCADYRDAVTATTIHDFTVRAARLDEHIRVHQLMMKVVGRLLDFTLMWERDRSYLLMGMLYRQWQDEGRADALCIVGGQDKENGKTLSLSLPDAEGRATLTCNLWSERLGFDKDFARNALVTLSEKNSAAYLRYFHQDSNQAIPNPLDANRWDNIKRNAPTGGGPQRGKQKIRNDFAHYNAINKSGERGPHLTYAVNAVRSLFGYDRKLKNAVSGAIVQVLEREGLRLEWKLEGDRLKHPQVMPVLDKHLDFLRRDAGAGAVLPLPIPRHSPRFVSMAKGLFEHDKGGWREIKEEKGKKSRKGSLRYPRSLRDAEAGIVPDAILSLEYSELPSESK